MALLHLLTSGHFWWLIFFRGATVNCMSEHRSISINPWIQERGDAGSWPGSPNGLIPPTLRFSHILYFTWLTFLSILYVDIATFRDWKITSQDTWNLATWLAAIPHGRWKDRFCVEANFPKSSGRGSKAGERRWRMKVKNVGGKAHTESCWLAPHKPFGPLSSSNKKLTSFRG